MPPSSSCSKPRRKCRWSPTPLDSSDRVRGRFLGDDGQQAMPVTPDRERVARQLAMAGEVGQDALMTALLEE